MTVKSIANSTQDGPSGVKVNQESFPLEEGEVGKGCLQGWTLRTIWPGKLHSPSGTEAVCAMVTAAASLLLTVHKLQLARI